MAYRYIKYTVKKAKKTVVHWMLLCFSGEGIKVVASIQNKSSRDIKPKYCLYGKYTFFADGEKLVKTEDILKEVGEAIPPSSSQTVTRIITIPPTKWISIFDCNIINVHFGLRVCISLLKTMSHVSVLTSTRLHDHHDMLQLFLQHRFI